MSKINTISQSFQIIFRFLNKLSTINKPNQRKMEHLEATPQEQDLIIKVDLNLRHKMESLRKWAMFVAIMGFIAVGFMVLFSFIMFFIGDTLYSTTPFPGSIAGFLYIVMAVLYFFPVYFLYKFADNLEHCLKGRDANRFHTTMDFLRRHYKFIGIMIIIGLALFILSMLIGVAGIIAGI